MLKEAVYFSFIEEDDGVVSFAVVSKDFWDDNKEVNYDVGYEEDWYNQALTDLDPQGIGEAMEAVLEFIGDRKKAENILKAYGFKSNKSFDKYVREEW